VISGERAGRRLVCHHAARGSRPAEFRPLRNLTIRGKRVLAPRSRPFLIRQAHSARCQSPFARGSLSRSAARLCRVIHPQRLQQQQGRLPRVESVQDLNEPGIIPIGRQLHQGDGTPKML
jgi:hypothetical protein